MPLLAEAYLHDLDPFAIQITESFGVRWYGLAYAVGFVIAWTFIRWMARSGRSPLEVKQIGDLMTWAIVGVLVGGRLGYAILYDRALFGFSGVFPFWNMLRIWEGGMASHGGIAGVIAICVIYGRRHLIPPLHILDMGAYGCTAGLSLGRLANFVNAELWGKALPAAMQTNTGAGPAPWWGVKYPDEVLDWAGTSKEMLLREKLGAVIGGDQSFLKGIADAVRDGNAQVIEIVQPMLTAFYPSQLFQAFTDGPILLGALTLIWLRPRKPGVIGCSFMIVYGVLRIASERYRQPDVGVPVWLGYSRGQWLSVITVLVGALILGWILRRPAPKLGGLLPLQPTAPTGSRTGT